MRITDSGNVGIRTTAPSSRLDVAGDAQFGFGATRSTFTATGDLNLASNADITLAGPTGYFTSVSSVNASAFFGNGAGLTDINATDNTKWVRTAPTVYLANATDNVVIQSTITVQGNAFSVGGSTFVVANGQVGIGTTDPGINTVLINGGANGRALELDSTSTSNTQLRFINSDGVVTTLDARGSTFDDFSIVGSNAELRMLLNNGRTGIGDSTPDAYLEVSASGGTSPLLMLSSNDANDGDYLVVTNPGLVGIGTTSPTALLHVSSANATAQATPLLVSSGTAPGQELLVVKGDGNVGFGTTAPTARLEIAGRSDQENTAFYAWQYGGTTGGLEMLLEVENGSTLQLIARDSGASTYAGIPGNTAGIASTWRDLAFSASADGVGAERMRITTAGNVGIGITNPGARLHVQAPTTDTNAMVVSTGTLASQELVRISTMGVLFAKGGVTYGGDLAEMYRAAGTLEAGDVAAFDTGPGGRRVRRASGGRGEALLGVVSTEPGMRIGWGDTSRDSLEGQVPVALTGRVPVKFSPENGPVKPGDMLAPSAERPGFAAKASGSGWVVGVALEESRPGSDTVLCYVNPHSWVSPAELREMKEELKRLKARLPR